MRASRRLVAFLAIGALGFLIDGGLLTLLAQMAGFNIYGSRAFSFTCATLTTWALNRVWTFPTLGLSARQKRWEYARYFSIQSGGALLNLGVFSWLVAAYGLREWLILPFAAGSLVGMIFNYGGARYWVFRQNNND